MIKDKIYYKNEKGHFKSRTVVQRKVRKPRDVFHHVYMKKGVRYISLTI